MKQHDDDDEDFGPSKMAHAKKGLDNLKKIQPQLDDFVKLLKRHGISHHIFLTVDGTTGASKSKIASVQPASMRSEMNPMAMVTHAIAILKNKNYLKNYLKAGIIALLLIKKGYVELRGEGGDSKGLGNLWKKFKNMADD